MIPGVPAVKGAASQSMPRPLGFPGRIPSGQTLDSRTGRLPSGHRDFPVRTRTVRTGENPAAKVWRS